MNNYWLYYIYGIIKPLIGNIVNALSEYSATIEVLFIVNNEIGFTKQAPIIAGMGGESIFRVYACDDSMERLTFGDDRLQLLYEKHRIETETARKKKWHYVITTCKTNFWCRWDAIFINNNHGYSIGNLHKSKPVWCFVLYEDSKANVLFLSGVAMLHHVARLKPELLSRKDKAFFISGRASHEWEFTRIASDQDQAKTALGYRNNDKVILICSHWTNHSLFMRNRTDILSIFSKRYPQYSYIVTAHPRLWFHKEDGHDGIKLEREIREFCEKHVNFRFVKTGNPSLLLTAADALVCDYSSIRVEFAYHERPVALFIAPDFEFQSNAMGYLYRNSSSIFSDTNYAPEALALAFSHRGKIALTSRQLYDYNIDRDKDAATLIKDFIEAVGPIGSTKSKKWDQIKEMEQKAMNEALDQLNSLIRQYPELDRL